MSNLFHDDQLGLLLGKVDDATDSLRERMHRVVQLLHSGYDAKKGEQEFLQIRETMAALKQSVSVLEVLTAEAEPNQPMAPPLDERLSQLARDIAAFPDLAIIERNDVRVSPLLDGFLSEEENLQDFIEELQERQQDSLDSETLKRELEILYQRLTELSNQTVEGELRGIFESLAQRWRESKRKLEILEWRYGFDGNGAHTLEDCGTHFRVSRERIRQVCQPCENDLNKRSVWTPALSRAIQWIEDNSPIPVEAVGPQLKQQGIGQNELDWDTLRSICKLLKQDLLFETKVIGHKQFLRRLGDDTFTRILSQARKAISRWGVATLEDIAASVNVEMEEVEQALKTQSGFELLDDNGWFWISSVPRNSLVTQIEKILAVAPRVDIKDLRAGVSRNHLRQGFAPPQRVLLELCRQLPGMEVDGRDVFVQNAQLLNLELGDTEQSIADVLFEHGPVMTRAKLESHCEQIPRGTFYTYLKYSPILDIYARGVYGLRGADVEPGFIESLQTEVTPRTRVLQDYGWTSKGEIWLGYKLSESMIGTGVCGVPAAMHQHIQGTYDLRTSDNAYIGKWTCRGYQAWNLNPLLRRRGGEVGDMLILVIDVNSRKVTARLGDESLLEQYQEPDNDY